MQPTPDAFRALARSSPWRWRSLHLTRRDGDGSLAEAWVERPGRMRVRSGGHDHEVVERLGEGRTVVVATTPGLAPGDPPVPLLRWPHEVAPVLRPDGLVAERPDDGTVQYDDPMWGSYDWVAMLDPVELSHHVELEDVRSADRAGRSTWWAVARPVDGYDPRCGCCPLLLSEISDRDEYGEGWVPSADVRYPAAYEVALDVATGVVVSVRAADHGTRWSGFEVDLHAATPAHAGRSSASTIR